MKPILCLSLALLLMPCPTRAADVLTYRLCANDFVQLKVYQEDDMETKFRLAKDGTVTLPLIGTVNLGGKTIEQATATIREELARDYLVNPQVTLTVIEYSKRRFTVLGEVQKPGSYEIPNEESMTLVQAVAMAGGYTRVANTARVSVTRFVNGRKLTLDARQASGDAPAFEILPDDTINIAERIF